MLLCSRWGLIPGRVTYRVLQHLLLIIPEAVRLQHCRDAEVEKSFTVRQATLLFDALSQVADSTLNRQPCPSANVALPRHLGLPLIVPILTGLVMDCG